MASFTDDDLILNNDGSVYHLNLKPGDIYKTIILVDDPGRVHRVSRHFDKVHFEMNQREFITHSGTYKGKEITVVSTGMGAENLEIVLVELDLLFNMDLKKKEPKKDTTTLNLIRIGTSGSIQEELKLGSLLVNKYAVGMGSLMNFYSLPQNEFEKSVCENLQKELKLNFLPYCASCDDHLKEKLAFDITEGNAVTSPGFYAPQGRNLRIKTKYDKLIDNLLYFHLEDFWFTNFEMETAALYAMSRLLGHHAISLNAITVNRISHEKLKNINKPMDVIIKKVLDRI